VLNNPLSLVDSRGLDCVYLNAAGDDTEFIDTMSDSASCGADGGYWIPGRVDPNNVQIDVNSGWIMGQSDLGTFAAGCNGGGCGATGAPTGSNPFGGWQVGTNLTWIFNSQGASCGNNAIACNMAQQLQSANQLQKVYVPPDSLACAFFGSVSSLGDVSGMAMTIANASKAASLSVGFIGLAASVNYSLLCQQPEEGN
jgi:hypothetical protein